MRRGEAAALHSYLSRYGYLRPELGTQPASLDRFDDATSRGLRLYQRFFGLEESGEMDGATAEQMAMPRCGVPDVRPEYVAQGSKWSTLALKYAFRNHSFDVSVAQTEEAVAIGLGQWADATDLTFTVVLPSQGPDLLASFTSGGSDINGTPFNGAIAHCYYPPPSGGAWAGDAHFNEDFNFQVTLPIASDAIDLVQLAMHEYGHGLGLDHTDVSGAIMWPSLAYGSSQRTLHQDDIDGIRSIYPLGEEPPPDPGGPPNIDGWTGTTLVSKRRSGESWTSTTLVSSRRSGGDWETTDLASYERTRPQP